MAKPRNVTPKVEDSSSSGHPYVHMKLQMPCSSAVEQGLDKALVASSNLAGATNSVTYFSGERSGTDRLR